MSHSHSAGHGAGHGHGHGHGDGDPDAPAPHVATSSRVVVLVLLLLAAVASVAGVVHYWPDSGAAGTLTGSVPFAADGVTYPEAVVETVNDACPLAEEDDPDTGQPAGSPLTDGTCGTIEASITSGRDDGRVVTLQVTPEVSASGLERGDTIELLLTPDTAEAQGVATYFSTSRGVPLSLLLLAFVVVVLAVARFRGLMALVGLAFSAAVVGLFVLPALLLGESPIPVAVAGSTAIMFVVLYTTHGFSMRTSTALVGTLAGVAVSAVVGSWAVSSARLTGVTGDAAGVLQSYAGGLDFQGLLVAAIIIAGLGVLNDVTITQASAVWELRGASPELTRRQVFTAGMRIGRDHIASTIYTIVFAYAGSALLVLLVISLYDRPLLDLVGTEELSEEVVRSLASSIGLVLAVPLTTAIAALTVGAGRTEAQPARRTGAGKRRA